MFITLKMAVGIFSENLASQYHAKLHEVTFRKVQILSKIPLPLLCMVELSLRNVVSHLPNYTVCNKHDHSLNNYSCE